jgi:hypothetical protein
MNRDMTTSVQGSAAAIADARDRRKRGAAAIVAGLAYGSGLVWAGACAVGSFRMEYLASPYWPAIPGLRTDTCGAAAFVVAAVSLAVSRYLRLDRKTADELRERVTSRGGSSPYRTGVAVAETVAVMSTGLVAYLSANAVTHPITLHIQATHFASWPTEGTLRAMALATCAASVGMRRYLQAA